jgi:hypothetical protein
MGQVRRDQALLESREAPTLPRESRKGATWVVKLGPSLCVPREQAGRGSTPVDAGSGDSAHAEAPPLLHKAALRVRPSGGWA